MRRSIRVDMLMMELKGPMKFLLIVGTLFPPDLLQTP